MTTAFDELKKKAGTTSAIKTSVSSFDALKSKVGTSNIASTLAPAPEVKGGFVGNLLTGSTQRFGHTIGESLAAPGNADLYTQSLKSYTDIQNNLQTKINEMKKQGNDTTHLQEVLKQHIASTPKLEDFTGDVINKTAGQVIGEGVGTGLEALSGGILSSGAETLGSKALTTFGKVKAGAKLGAAYGAVGGGAGAMQEGGGVGETALGALAGGAIGGALGGGLSYGGTKVGQMIGNFAKSASQKFEGAIGNIAKQYEKVLPLTATERAKEATLLARTGDNVYTTAAKHGISIGSEDAPIKLQEISNQFENATKLAQKNESAYFNVNEIKQNAFTQIDENLSSETERQLAKDKVNKEIDAIVESNKSSVIKDASGATKVKSDLVERLRRTGNDWGKYNKINPDSVKNSAGRSLADSVRDQVEKEGTFPAYREANREWGKIIHTQQVLGKIDALGKPFKTIGGLSGSISRKILSGALGYHTGGVGGAILAEIGSEYAAKILANPELRTFLDRKIVSKFLGKNPTPQSIKNLTEQVRQYIDKQEGLLKLPAPSFIPMGSKTPAESGVKLIPAKKNPVSVNPKTGKFQTSYSSDYRNGENVERAPITAPSKSIPIKTNIPKTIPSPETNVKPVKKPAFSKTVYRGGQGNSPSGTFYSPDKKVAQAYADRKGGGLTSKKITLNNPLVVDADHAEALDSMIRTEKNLALKKKLEAALPYVKGNRYVLMEPKKAGKFYENDIIEHVDPVFKQYAKEHGNDGIVRMDGKKVFEVVDFQKKTLKNSGKATLGTTVAGALLTGASAFSQIPSKTTYQRPPDEPKQEIQAKTVDHKVLGKALMQLESSSGTNMGSADPNEKKWLTGLTPVAIEELKRTGIKKSVDINDKEDVIDASVKYFELMQKRHPEKSPGEIYVDHYWTQWKHFKNSKELRQKKIDEFNNLI